MINNVVVKLWNSVPLDIRKADSLPCFKNNITRFNAFIVIP